MLMMLMTMMMMLTPSRDGMLLIHLVPQSESTFCAREQFTSYASLTVGNQ